MPKILRPAPVTHAASVVILAALVGCPGQKGEEEFEVPCEDTAWEAFPVNFVVMLDDSVDPDVPADGRTLTDGTYGAFTGEDVFYNEIDILNDEFQDTAGDPPCDGPDHCVTFEFKQVSWFDDVSGSTCTDIIDAADSFDETIAMEDMDTWVDTCEDELIAPECMLNYYVYDWVGSGNLTSHGRTNCDSSEDCHPYVTIDYARLFHQYAVEEHEFGHVFSLDHECASPELTSDAESSNIMEGNDCEADGQIGQRDEKFTSTQVGDIVATARTIRENCCDGSGRDAYRYMVAGEPACSPGTGRFALLQREFVDADQDGTARADLVPVLMSGNHMGRLGWITSASVVGFGSYSTFYAGQVGYPLAWDDTDALDTSHTYAFSTSVTSRTWAAGLVGTGSRWAVQGLAASTTAFTPPVVDLTWTCNPNVGSTPMSLTRPAGYRLPSSDLGGSWAQQILLRPNFSTGQMWVELLGRPLDAQRIPLEQNGSVYEFTFDVLGLTVDGEVWPAGSKLGFAMTSGTWHGSSLTPFTKQLSPY